MNYAFYTKMIVIALAAALLAGCGAVFPTSLPTLTAAAPTYTPYVPTPTEIQPTHTPILPTPTTAAQATLPPPPPTTTAPVSTYNLDFNGLANGILAETIPAVPADQNGPYWEQLPQYTRLTLQNYPITGHVLQPQIFIYPLKDLAGWNEGAGKIAANLQDLLVTHQLGQRLPFMPLFNASQVIHVQPRFLDFKNGQGLRYLTEFDQAVLPINNHELFYTYQGITADGKYYVAAVLPVNLPGLPSDELQIDQAPAKFKTDFTGYLADIVKQINETPNNGFTPDLKDLDAMMQSLEIR